MAIPAFLKKSPQKALTLFGFLKRYWYFTILIFVMLPGIIDSIQTAVDTNNPTYPFFDLASRILTGDRVLNDHVNTLRENPDELIGMEKPSTGIWKHTVYYAKFSYNVIYRLFGDVWVIFFPLIIFFKLTRMRNTSEESKNFYRAAIYFIAYLFVTNVIMLIYEISIGTTSFTVDPSINRFTAYYQLFIQVLPLHGFINLVTYLVQLIATP